MLYETPYFAGLDGEVATRKSDEDVFAEIARVVKDWASSLK